MTQRVRACIRGCNVVTTCDTVPPLGCRNRAAEAWQSWEPLILLMARKAMRIHVLATGLALLVTVALRPLPAAAQIKAQPKATPSAKPGKTPARTLDGKPNLEGIYSYSTITPLQRPEALAGKNTLTAEEAAEFEASENKRLNRDLYDPEKGQPSAGYAPRSQGGVLSYNEFWYERGNKLTQDRRTSLITSPANGRIPFTDTARKKNAERTQQLGSGFADSHLDRSVADRCLLGFNAGPPMHPGAYNNNLQIFQTSRYVVILNEMVHNVRIIPIDGRPHTSVRQWSGDSRGRWEGDTLVVETTNFVRETSLQGTTADTTVVERFTRMDDDTIKYEFMVSDPTAYTQPWSAMFPLNRIHEPVFEYACHEGNYAMTNILAGQRNLEKDESQRK